MHQEPADLLRKEPESESPLVLLNIPFSLLNLNSFHVPSPDTWAMPTSFFTLHSKYCSPFLSCANARDWAKLATILVFFIHYDSYDPIVTSRDCYKFVDIREWRDSRRNIRFWRSRTLPAHATLPQLEI